VGAIGVIVACYTALEWMGGGKREKMEECLLFAAQKLAGSKHYCMLVLPKATERTLPGLYQTYTSTC
jgi:hypothetical protein